MFFFILLSMRGYFVFKNITYTNIHTQTLLALFLTLSRFMKAIANHVMCLFVSDLTHNRNKPIYCEEFVYLYSLLVCCKRFLILFREV